MIAQGRLGRLRQHAGEARLPRLRRRKGEPRQRPGARRQAGRPRAGRAGRRPLLRLRARVVLACATAFVVLGGAWLWVRDSPLVAVDRVTVIGATGPDASGIRQALVAAARNMTTLDVHMNALQTAVAPFPVVKQLRVSTQFPHAIRIRVIEEIPVATLQFDGQTVAVAADGRLLRDAVAAGYLPVIGLPVTPGGRRLTDREALRAVALLAAAPSQLLGHISQVATVAPHGLVAQIRSGPAIYFGDLTTLQAKWVAASEVLNDPRSAGCAYIDVTDPQRPAAGSEADTSGDSVAGTSGESTAGSAGTSGESTAGSAGTSGESTAGSAAGSAVAANGG